MDWGGGGGAWVEVSRCWNKKYEHSYDSKRLGVSHEDHYKQPASQIYISMSILNNKQKLFNQSYPS